MSRKRVFVVGSVVMILFAFFVVGCSKEASITITSLTANPNTLHAGETSTITAAVDYDGDGTVTYEWSADDGIISGSGSTVTWTAPDSAGTFLIALTVSDGDVSDDATVNVLVDTIPPADYFPLAIGNYWTFDVHWSDTVGSTDTYTQTQTIDDTVQIDSEIWFVMYNTSSDSSVDSIYYRKGTDYLYGGYYMYGAFFAFPAAPLAPEIGMEWDDVETLLVDITIHGEVEGYETITVPSGTYDCYRELLTVESSIYNFSLRSWFADGVGPIRIVNIEVADSTDMQLQEYFLN